MPVHVCTHSTSTILASHMYVDKVNFWISIRICAFAVGSSVCCPFHEKAEGEILNHYYLKYLTSRHPTPQIDDLWMRGGIDSHVQNH